MHAPKATYQLLLAMSLVTAAVAAATPAAPPLFAWRRSAGGNRRDADGSRQTSASVADATDAETEARDNGNNESNNVNGGASGRKSTRYDLLLGAGAVAASTTAYLRWRGSRVMANADAPAASAANARMPRWLARQQLKASHQRYMIDRMMLWSRWYGDGRTPPPEPMASIVKACAQRRVSLV
jgi:hypothetical protein